MRKAAYKAIKLLYSKQLKSRTERFANIIKDYCNVTQVLNSESEYCKACNKCDILIYGSDQIWNPFGFHPIWYGNYDSIKAPKIAYAPSMGTDRIPSNLIEKYRNALNDFQLISTREKSTSEWLSILLGKNVQTVLDPSFLFSADEWTELLKIKSDYIESQKPYILSFFLKDNRNHYKAVKSYAKKSDMRIVTLPYRVYSYFFMRSKAVDAGPAEFISLIKNATCVFTDSFHCIVFSIIFKKAFYAFERFSQNSENNQNMRINDLLRSIGLSERIVPFNTTKLENTKPVEYKNIDVILEKEIEHSKKYLLNSIMMNQEV